MIPAAVAERGRRLQTKAQQGRPMASILKLQPSGKAALKDKPRRDAFEAGAAGDKQWAEATRDATEGFVLASRQASTDLEHVTYMLEWNKLLVQEGFGAYVREAKLGEKNTFTDGRRTIGAVLDEDGNPKVEPPIRTRRARRP